MHGDLPTFNNFLLDSLPAATIEVLRPHLREVELAVGEQLYQQDVIPPSVYFPVTAVVSKYQILEEGSVIEIALGGNEGAVGLAPTLVLKGSIHYSEVLIAGKSYKVPAGRVLELSRRDNVFQIKANDILQGHIQQVSRRMICNQYHTLEPRLATWLLMVSERCGSSTLRVTHDQMARALGFFRPSVTLAVQALKEKGAVAQSRGRVTITRRDKLHKIACECFETLSLASAAKSSLPQQF
jgi:CRP-like cAMP-binding protein